MVRTYDPVRVMREVERILELDKGCAEASDRVAHIRSLVLAMAQAGPKPDDPVRELASFAADQWSSVILLALRDGPFRYSVLHRLVGAIGPTDSISQRILTLKLKKLRYNGLITRELERENPPVVSYGLSNLGRDFVKEIEARASWVLERLPEIEAAREQAKTDP